MRVGPGGTRHLTYCTNIHPGEGWEEVFANLVQHLPSLKARLAPEEPFGIGLRLSARAAEELLTGGRLRRFRAWLDAQGLYVFTINGFPYGGFHRQVVKDRVYAPDWRTTARVDYSLHLAHVLAALLPDDVEEGSISTSPVSYKPWLPDEAARIAAFRAASRHLAEVAATMVCLRRQTGRHLHLDLEPEPDCLIENTAETLDFFERWLLPVGRRHLAQRLGCSPAEAERHLRAHVGVCYDTCHFALAYETPAEALRRLREAGIGIGKVQLSAALQLAFPEEDPATRVARASRLVPFAESTYLHQVVERYPDGMLRRYADLPEALADVEHTAAREWRVHYHVPLFSDATPPLQTTRDSIVETLAVLRTGAGCPHLEIETYTWDVLPPALKTDLLTSVQREYEWVVEQVTNVE